jgi:hypothetical protein
MARQSFNDWLVRNEMKSPSNPFIDVVLKTAIAYGSHDDWNLIFKMAENTEQYQERIMLIEALTESHDSDLLE